MSTLSQFLGGSTIKSIQRGTITVPSNVTTATASIPVPVNPSKSVLTLLGSNTSYLGTASGYWNRTAYVEMNVAGTTLTASGALRASDAGFSTASTTELTIAWQIVEYN